MKQADITNEELNQEDILKRYSDIAKDNNREKLYNNLRKRNSQFTRSYEDFSNDMNDEDNRKRLYDNLVKDGYKRTYEDFSNDIGYGDKMSVWGFDAEKIISNKLDERIKQFDHSRFTGDYSNVELPPAMVDYYEKNPVSLLTPFKEGKSSIINVANELLNQKLAENKYKKYLEEQNKKLDEDIKSFDASKFTDDYSNVELPPVLEDYYEKNKEKVSILNPSAYYASLINNKRFKDKLKSFVANTETGQKLSKNFEEIDKSLNEQIDTLKEKIKDVIRESVLLHKEVNKNNVN